ncbi:MAG TPA: hypothetical protein VHD87_15435 [Acidimicrobiales bacterium]|nr:hypothetical protein [Acidimicrobiales bacterium]
MTLSLRLRRVANAAVDSVTALIEDLQPPRTSVAAPVSWADVRARPTPATSRALAERMLREADDAFARLDAMRARHPVG